MIQRRADLHRAFYIQQNDARALIRFFLAAIQNNNNRTTTNTKIKPKNKTNY